MNSKCDIVLNLFSTAYCQQATSPLRTGRRCSTSSCGMPSAASLSTATLRSRSQTNSGPSRPQFASAYTVCSLPLCRARLCTVNYCGRFTSKLCSFCIRTVNLHSWRVWYWHFRLLYFTVLVHKFTSNKGSTCIGGSLINKARTDVKAAGGSTKYRGGLES